LLVLLVGDCPNPIGIIPDLDLLLVLQIFAFLVPEGQVEFQGVDAVDLAGDNDVVGVFEHSFLFAIQIENGQ